MDTTPQDVPVPAGSPEPAWWRKLKLSRFVWLSIGAHLLLGGIASVYVVQHILPKRKTNFVGPPPSTNPSTHALEHKVQMQKKQQTMSAPAAVKRVTTTATNAKIALPQMPDMPSNNASLTPMTMAGMGGNGTGLSMGGGTGGIGGGGGGPALFGLRSRGNGALVGSFYDFKQKPDGTPTDMKVLDDGFLPPIEKPANEEAANLVGRFANGGFNEDLFKQYFKGPVPLYATQIFIPTITSEDGPEEFGLKGKVRGRRWVVVYRGKVTPPEGGRYWFVGVADDYLVVRFRGRVVLDGSLHHPTGKKPLQEYAYSNTNLHFNQGDPVDVSSGQTGELEILIGEQPGGETSAFLLLEKQGVQYTKDAKASPILPIFKVAPSNTNPTGRDAPPTAPDTSWSVWKADKM